MLCHLSRVRVATFVGRMRLEGGFCIFASVRGHVIWPILSPVAGREVQGSYPWQSPLSDNPRSCAAPVRGCHLDPDCGTLEGTKSGKDCSSSSAVEEAFVPSCQASVEGCVPGLANLALVVQRLPALKQWNVNCARGWAIRERWTRSGN